MSNAKFFVVILSIVFLGISEGCKCLPTHPQEKYCKADYVILGVPKTRVNVTSTRIFYRFGIDSILRATPGAQRALNDRKIYSSADSASCGSVLTTDLRQRYLITGRLNNRETWTNTCEINWLWNDVSPALKNAFRNTYSRSCACSVVREMDPNINSPTVCVYNLTDPDSDCYYNFGVCLRDRNGICKWKRTTALSHCLTL